MNFSGLQQLGGSLVALITPFYQNTIDISALCNLIHFQILSGTRGLVICGTTGEGSLLCDSERDLVISTSVEAAKMQIPIIVGCSSTSTWKTLKQVKKAEQLKADAALILPPYYVKPTQRGIFEHFKFIHDQTTIPIILYNNPGRTAVDLSIDLVIELSNLPRVIGLKDSTTDLSRTTLFKKRIKKDFKLLCGDDPLVAGYLAHGGDGIISISANVVPSLYRELLHTFFDNEWDNFQELNKKLMPLALAFVQEINPIPIKYALSLMGKCQNELRLPLTPAQHSTQEIIKTLLKEFIY
jgi:4-hydroxy-tetrahydrodipicolinate synthase